MLQGLVAGGSENCCCSFRRRRTNVQLPELNWQILRWRDYSEAIGPRDNCGCRNPDEIKTKEDIWTELVQQFQIPNGSVDTIKNLRKTYAGLQMAIISLLALLPEKLLDVGKAKIGWLVCRIRTKISLDMGCKCLEYVLIARSISVW